MSQIEQKSSNDWTVDTWVLHRATLNDLDAVYFLLAIQSKKHSIAFDHEAVIEKQYQRCLKLAEKEHRVGYDILKKWLVRAINYQAKHYSGNLTNKIVDELKSMRFDKDDWAFVGTCSKTVRKLLVSEDGDYTPEMKVYFQSRLLVRVLDLKSAQEDCDT